MSGTIDWLDTYQEKFSHNEMLSNLRSMGFHGKVVINFADGVPHTSHIEWCVKPYASASYMEIHASNSTLKKED